ncbi:PAS domain S-box-containing protein [Paenibacillus sp. UNCCL117]|uniref:HAMP domain-containing histidine kinase n=1 Tax=unclassified Paenibacillus TaxID=185978 RepID=UPI0008802B12|nr:MULTISPECIES: HAMP domain-containing histidine kinase [unclassified Paenibacillus]SDD97774.1 PAS domain S-box-containing protein [Paenibacillus sp. cl123]SFW56108.1 PAS domain S-box-containing protein [Paenibacillus sp. UNCCL117]
MNNQSMRMHLTFAFAIVALIPILVLGGLQVYQIKRITDDYNKTQAQTTYRLADAVQTYIYYHKNAVETLATTVSASSPPFRTRESLTLKLQSVHSNLPSFAELYVVDNAGKINAAYPGRGQTSVLGADVSGRDYFQEVKKTNTTTITPLFRGFENPKKPVLAIVSPVYNEWKQWDGLIVGVLDLEAFAQLVAKYDYGTDAYPVVLDNMGRAIYHPSGSIVDALTDLSGEQVVSDTRTHEKGQGKYRLSVEAAEELITYKHIQDLDWTVWVARSYQAVNAAFIHSLWTTFLLLVLTLLVTVIVGTLLAKRLNNTIHALVGYTEKLADGDFGEPDKQSIAARRGPYELMMLAEHFSRMAEQIKENQHALIALNAELESRVTERTQSLLRKNRELAAVNRLLTPVMPNRTTNDLIEESMTSLRDLIGQEVKLYLYPHQGRLSLGGRTGGDGLQEASRAEHEEDVRRPVVPIHAGNVELGRLILPTSAESSLAEGDRRFLQTFANTTAIILHNDMLHSSIRHEHATWNAVLESMSEAIVLIDTDHKVVYANRRMSDMFQLEDNQLVSMTEDELFQIMEDKLLKKDGAWTGLRTNPRIPATCTVLDENGKERFISVSVFHVMGEERSFGKGYIWRDITKEHEIDALKNDLISLASHEFKTPITSIRGGVETLLRTDAEWDEAFKRELLEGIREDIGRIQDLIDEWLDISKIESGALRVNLQPVRLHAVIQSAIRRIPRFAGMADARFEVELDSGLPLIRADKSRLEQVMVNLFLNAVRYNVNRPHIRVTAEPDADYVHIRVQDNGIGMAAEHLDKIFERFYRVDVSSSRQTGGTGLGLTICKGIMEAHGGYLSVTSSPGAGSSFIISVPKYDWEEGDGHEEA